MVSYKTIMSDTSSILGVAVLGRMALGNSTSVPKSERFLIDYLPHYMQDYMEMNAIMQTEQPEIDALWSSVENAFADQYIMDATEYGVMGWESMLGISPKATETMDERKFRILARLNQELPYTMRKLEQALTNLCGADGYSIDLQAAKYHIEVKLAEGNRNKYSEVENILKKMIPANMTQYIQLMYNTNDLLTQFTHAQLSAYTHDQLRIEVFN